MAVSLNFETSELQGFANTLAKVGTVPQKCVTKAAKLGATMVKSRMESTVPVRSGSLKRGIELHGEKHRGKKGKKVYEVRMSPSMNDVFQKKIVQAGRYNGKSGNRAYYPASIEYGFMARAKDGGIQYVPGRHFMKSAGEALEASVKTVMIRTVTEEMEKEWNKKK